MRAYEKNGFIIFKSGKGFVVYNKLKMFNGGHTHLRNFKASKDAIFFVLNRKIPKTADMYYLISLQRISIDPVYIEQIEQLKNVRKQKTKQHYYNRKGR